MIKKIDHIGIVVKDLEKSRQIYEKELHLEFHHIAYEVDDLDDTCRSVATTLEPKDTIQPGAGGLRIFFVNPKNMDNVETEFVEFPG